ncbi:hypothetical protein E2562_030214 [Oryza meyeriana var. granulata]|uniref:Non-haem dioxygenase N-terminal domain-containing protein n=1 Tax=Oryza meyeriana var. granulata TaxID=110450 RepID=A0A6G1D918_9ORYZ|nr:hypothetical protein E2562_030214 [Oryza meyeriana var. granulata]
MLQTLSSPRSQQQGVGRRRPRSDLGAPPSRYVLREKDRPAINGTVQAQPELAAIPTIDVARLAEPGDVDEAAKLRSALQSWGLFAVTGHGMPEPFLDEILSATREFFNLRPEEKEKYSNVVDGGETYQNEATASTVSTPTSRSSTGPAGGGEVAAVLAGPPVGTPARWLDLEEYTLRSEQVFKRVLAAMSRPLGFKEEFFVDKPQQANTVRDHASYAFYNWRRASARMAAPSAVRIGRRSPFLGGRLAVGPRRSRPVPRNLVALVQVVPPPRAPLP